MIEGQQSRYLELVECFRLDCLARQLCRFIDEVAPKMVLNKIARKASQVRDLTIISQFHSNNIEWLIINVTLLGLSLIPFTCRQFQYINN